MKKAIYHINMRVLLILIFSVFILTIQANSTIIYAQQPYTPKVVSQDKTVHRGQSFEIDLNLSENGGLVSMCLMLTYDNSVMQLTSCTQGEALNSMTFTTSNTENGYSGYGTTQNPFKLLWDSTNQDIANGKLVTLTFETMIDAEVGDYIIDIDFETENTTSEYGNHIELDVTDSVITLVKGEYQAIYLDYDKNTLYERDYNENDVPAYQGENPTREEDDEYTYEFIGWRSQVSQDINVLIFEADYKRTPKPYTLFCYVDGSSNDPNGVIDEEDYYYSVEIPFGEIIITPDTYRKYYKFYGWYSDENLTQYSTFSTMPARNVRLYGYYKFDIRERDIPIITLVNEQMTTTTVVVSAYMVVNTGINGMILTVDYDLDNLKLEAFTTGSALSSMQFDTTNIAKISEKDFKFYYESAINNYDVGEFLTLYFTILPNAQNSVYEVNFTYDYHSDATYVTNEGEITYTKLEFRSAEVPVGEIDYWETDIGERHIEVTSATGKPINVRLLVDLVNEDIKLDSEVIESVVGKNMRISSAYSIRLIQNKNEIQPNTTLTIKINLTDQEIKSTKLKFYYYTEDEELEEIEFKIEGEKLVFTTDHLSNWLIFSNYKTTGAFGSNSKVVMLIAYPILLAITAMAYAFVLKTKIKKNNEGGTQ